MQNEKFRGQNEYSLKCLSVRLGGDLPVEPDLPNNGDGRWRHDEVAGRQAG